MGNGRQNLVSPIPHSAFPICLPPPRLTAQPVPRKITDSRPVRLVAQDSALSRRRQGFDSPTGYSVNLCGSASACTSWHSSPVVPGFFCAFISRVLLWARVLCRLLRRLLAIRYAGFRAPFFCPVRRLAAVNSQPGKFEAGLGVERPMWDNALDARKQESTPISGT